MKRKVKDDINIKSNVSLKENVNKNDNIKNSPIIKKGEMYALSPKKDQSLDNDDVEVSQFNNFTEPYNIIESAKIIIRSNTNSSNSSQEKDLFLTKIGFDSIYKLTEEQSLSPNDKMRNKSKLISNTVNSKKTEQINQTNLLTDNNSIQLVKEIDNFEQNQNNYNKIAQVPHLLKLEHPDIQKLLYKPDLDIKNKQNFFSLLESTEAIMFVNSVVALNNNNLINNLSVEFKKHNHDQINKDGAFEKIYTKCEKEIKVSLQIKKLITIEQQKSSDNSQIIKIKNINKQQNKYLIIDVTKENTAKKEKILIYNSSKGASEVFNSNMPLSYKIDLIPKVSEKLAFLNRKFLMKDLGYDFANDEEFIFYEELQKKQKLDEDRNKDKINKKGKYKHSKIEEIIEKAIKDKENIINKLNKGISRIIKNRIGQNSNYENLPGLFINQEINSSDTSSSKVNNIKKSIYFGSNSGSKNKPISLQQHKKNSPQNINLNNKSYLPQIVNKGVIIV